MLQKILPALNFAGIGLIVSVLITWIVVSATATPPMPIMTGESYTLSQIATHSTRQSCWSAVRGNVYDLTTWISKHPGGDPAILSMCGKDGTDAFVSQHQGQKNPEAVIVMFQIGVLSK